MGRSRREATKGTVGTPSTGMQGGIPGVFLFLAVAVSCSVGSISYMGGSSPEWIALKSSVSLFVIGIMGWVVSLVVSQSIGQSSPSVEGSTVDITLPETGPASAGAVRAGL